MTTHPSSLVTYSQVIEAGLKRYAPAIGPDLEGYRNHIYRVLNYTLAFLGESSQRNTLEVALVYHDIALWTDRELAYLEPSAALALADNERLALGCNPDLLRLLIMAHHKITPYRGPHAEMVNGLRKADWVDFSRGRLSKGLPREFIQRVMAALPPNGFYESLDRLGGELSNNRFQMIGKFMKVFAL